MLLIVKDLNIKTLVGGDKTARLVLETTSPEQIDALKELATQTFIKVSFENAQTKAK